MPEILHSPLAERVRFGLLAAILVWAPVPWGSYAPWSMLLLAWTICALAAWHLLSLAVTGRSVTAATRQATIPLVLLGMVATWQWIQVPWISVSPADTREFALLATAFTAAAFLVTELVHSRRRVVALVWILLLAATAQSVFAVGLVYSGGRYTLFEGSAVTPGVASGTFFNRNHFAAYMNVALALGIGMMVAQLGEPAHGVRQWLRNATEVVLSGKAGLRILLVILVIGLILTRSRMGNMGFFVALSVTAVLWTLVTRRFNRGIAIFLGSILVLDLTIIGAYFGVEEVATRLQETTYRGDARGDIIGAMLPMVQDHWFTGTGAGTFTVAFIPYRTPDIGVFYRNAHNDYLQVLVELGILGAACLALFWAWCLARSIGLMTSRDRWFRGMGFGGVMLTTYAAVHATVEFNLYIPGLALTLLVALMLPGCVIPTLREQARREARRQWVQ